MAHKSAAVGYGRTYKRALCKTVLFSYGIVNCNDFCESKSEFSFCKCFDGVREFFWLDIGKSYTPFDSFSCPCLRSQTQIQIRKSYSSGTQNN